MKRLDDDGKRLLHDWMDAVHRLNASIPPAEVLRPDGPPPEREVLTLEKLEEYQRLDQEVREARERLDAWYRGKG